MNKQDAIDLATSYYDGQPIIATTSIEIVIQNGTLENEFYFPDDKQLINAEILGIQTYDATLFPKSPQTNTALIASTNVPTVAVTLQNFNGMNFVDGQPLIDFYRTFRANGYNTVPLKFASQRIVWTKSFIQVTDTAWIAALANPVTVFFMVYYIPANGGSSGNTPARMPAKRVKRGSKPVRRKGYR